MNRKSLSSWLSARVQVPCVRTRLFCCFPLALLFLSSIAATAQIAPPYWLQPFGSRGPGFNIGNSVQVGPDQNVYVTGQFTQTPTFGSTTLTSAGGSDIFVAQYSPTGTLQWIATAGGVQDDIGQGVALDANANVYVTGTLGGQATFHSSTAGGTTITVGTTGQKTIYLAKYNNAGTLQWIQTGTGSGNYSAGGIAVNAAGIVYITAKVQSDITFSSGDGATYVVLGNGSWHTVLLRYSVNGFFHWAVTNTSSNKNSAGIAVAVDADGSAYLTGWMENTTTFTSWLSQSKIVVTGFSPGQSDSNQPDDIYLAKYNSNGDAVWVNHIGGYRANPNAVAVSPDGQEVTLVGTIGNINTGSSGEAETIASSQPPGSDFNLGGGDITSPYNTDEVIATYDPTGVLIRAQRRGGSGNESANGVAYNLRSNLYVSGVAEVNDQPQPFVDAYWDGNLVWEANATNAGIGGQDTVSPALAVNAAGSAFVTGGYTGTASFGGFNLHGIGHSEVFVSPMAPFPTVFNFISVENLTPFQSLEVGAVSSVKTVRIQLTHVRALNSIAIAPGFTDFQLVSVSGCAVDGTTVNPALTVCTAQVTFSPKYPGLRTAPLVLTDNAGIKSSVGLTGIGLAPQAALTPGIITTIVGNGTAGFGGDGGSATAAVLNAPQDAQLDSAGNLYIADTANNRVRKVDLSGIITTVVPADGSRNTINGLALDAAGDLYFTNGNGGNVRKMDLNGVITRFAGGGTGGDGGPASEAALTPSGKLAIDTTGNVYIAEYGAGRVRKVDTQGIISTVATGVDPEYGLAVDTAGNLYIPDYGSHIVQKLDTNGVLSTFAGNGTSGFSGEGGPATQAELSNPTGVAVDAAGNVYVADLFNYRVRRIDVNGTIKTVAGNGTAGYSGDGGTATTAEANAVYGMATDPAGGFYVIDTNNNRIRQVDVSESAVNFTAPQDINTTSPSQEVVVTNTGNQRMGLTGLSLTGEFGQLRGTSRDCTNTTGLGGGFSCALRLTLAPTTTGTLTGSATVTDNSLNVPGTTQTITLTGTGVTPATAILSASALTFGNQPTNTASALQTVTISNIGGASLVINKIALTGANPASFVTSNDCGAPVAGGGNCTIDVRFDPQTATQLTASIIITDNASDSPQTVTLTGTGVPGTGGPIATFSATALDFTANSEQMETLTNTGGSPLVITSFTVTGPNATSFVYGPPFYTTCNSSLARGASCQFIVNFQPPTTGAYSASLVIVDNASDSPQTIALTGTGPFATVSPTTLDFGSQAVGTTSAPQTVTLTNTGGGSLVIQTITNTGANPNSFTHSSNCGGLGGNRTHGESCQIMLSFKPETTGALSATININSNANSPTTITVTGTGTAP
jgi:hypothetical protein